MSTKSGQLHKEQEAYEAQRQAEAKIAEHKCDNCLFFETFVRADHVYSAAEINTVPIGAKVLRCAVHGTLNPAVCDEWDFRGGK